MMASSSADAAGVSATFIPVVESSNESVILVLPKKTITMVAGTGAVVSTLGTRVAVGGRRRL